MSLCQLKLPHYRMVIFKNESVSYFIGFVFDNRNARACCHQRYSKRFKSRWIRPFPQEMFVNIASYWLNQDRPSVDESIKAPDYTASWMTGINVKIWNLENTIKNLTDQVKVLQKQNDAMKTDVKVASKTGIGFLGLGIHRKYCG